MTPGNASIASQLTLALAGKTFCGLSSLHGAALLHFDGYLFHAVTGSTVQVKMPEGSHVPLTEGEMVAVVLLPVFVVKIHDGALPDQVTQALISQPAADVLVDARVVVVDDLMRENYSPGFRIRFSNGGAIECTRDKGAVVFGPPVVQ